MAGEEKDINTVSNSILKSAHLQYNTTNQKTSFYYAV